MVQDARRLMRVPVGVDVCAVLEQEVRHVEVAVDDGQGERHVENLLRPAVPLEVAARTGSLRDSDWRYRRDAGLPCRTSCSPARGRPCLPHAADRLGLARCE